MEEAAIKLHKAMKATTSCQIMLSTFSLVDSRQSLPLSHSPILYVDSRQTLYMQALSLTLTGIFLLPF